MKHRGWRLTSVLLLACALMVAQPGAASAHTELAASSPADGAALTSAPRSLLLTFTESVQIVAGGVRLLDESGSPVAIEGAHHPRGRDEQVEVALPNALGPGSFVIDWQVVSDDGHLAEGASTFSVGAVTVAAVGAGTPGPTTSRATGFAVGAARFVGLAGFVMLAGGLGLLCLCWPGGWTDRRSRHLVAAGAMAIAVAAAVNLVLLGSYGAGSGLRSVFDAEILTASLHSRAGALTALRAVAALAATVALMRTGRQARLGAAGLTVVIGVTMAAGGHAGDGSDRVLATGLDLVHLASASLWLGGLALLLIGPLSVRMPTDAGHAAARRFSRLAGLCVVVLLATGVIAAARRTGSFDALGQTAYGQVVLIKSALLATILTFAAGARRVVQRRLTPDGTPSPVLVTASTRPAAGGVLTRTRPPLSRTRRPDVRADLRVLRQSVLVELLLGAGVLVATAVLIGLPPARAAYLPSSSTTVQAGPTVLRVTSAATGAHGVTIDIAAVSGAAPVQVTATAALPAGDVGPIDLLVEPAPRGRWVSTRRTLPIAGDWVIALRVRTNSSGEFFAQTSSTVR